MWNMPLSGVSQCLPQQREVFSGACVGGEGLQGGGGGGACFALGLRDAEKAA